MRMSLAERTVESIAKTPRNGRRRSSFFNQDSPIPPRSRPQSSHGTGSRSSSRNGGSIEDDVPPVPPVKTPLKSSVRKPALSQTNGRNGVSTTTLSSRTTVPGRLGGNKPIAPSLRASTTKPVARPLRTGNSTSSQSTQPKASRPVQRNERTPRPAVKTPKPSSNKAVDSPKPRANSAKSSSALREQIRQAKAARKSSSAKGPDLEQSSPVPEVEALHHDDPFNQGLKGGALVMRKRVDNARMEGRLNISAMGLKELPEDVLKMYDYEFNKKESDIAWGEVVDLTRFIAADNEIETIPNECFPDVDFNAMAQDEDNNGLQFGGIEYLDLHGNLLYDVPVGLRRLERLTSLNLVSANIPTFE
jgi:hypothetical protein